MKNNTILSQARKANLQRIRFIHLLPDAAFGDAVTNDCLEIARTMRQWGFQGEIYGERIDTPLVRQVRPISAYVPQQNEVVIFHYSTWSETAEALISRQRRNVIVIYHNLTPETFFAGLPVAASSVQRARALLPALAPISALGLGKSEYSERELVEAGFGATGVLPILMQWQSFNGPLDRQVMEETGAGAINIITVGRVVPNKRIDDVLKFYAYFQELESHSRLYIIGSDSIMPEHRVWLGYLARRLKVVGRVRFTGRVSMDAWRAYYRTAHLYVCMSEHEGFCVPLVEAMYAGIPVLAYAAAAIPETLGKAGILIHQKDPRIAAELAYLACHDPALRSQLIKTGKRRAEDFSRPHVEQLLARYLSTAIEQLDAE